MSGQTEGRFLSFVKLFSPIRWWLLLALLYTAGSLAWLNARVKRDSPPPVRPAFVLPAGSALQPAVRRDSPNQAVFTVSFTAADMDRTSQYRFQLVPRRDLPRCTVQVLAEGDHHLSFSHLYRCSRLPEEGFSFTVPFLDDEMYWKTPGHTGAWSPWERAGLRRFEIKVFSSAPLAGAGLELRVRADPAPARAISLAWIRPSAESLPLGERFEAAFDLAGWHGNPFDYREMPVRVDVVEPGGKTRSLLPFLYQDFAAVTRLEGERIRPAGPKHFLVRYRPLVEGPHAYRVILPGAGGTNRVLREGRFTVTPGAAPGFLSVSRRAPHFFERGDGRFVYLLGWNLPYPVDRPYGADYVPYLPPEASLSVTRKMLDDVADSGGNFIRFWLSDWFNGLEWSRDADHYGGILRYNLKNAWLNDKIVEHCERRGIYMQWETLNHVRLSRSYGWPVHPYNRDNGGFLDDSQEFWTSVKVHPLSENRLSYIVARYADSPAIQSWNLMSEPDLVSRDTWFFARAFILSQMAFVARLDPYGHVTSSHLCLPDHDLSFFKEKRLEFVNANAYPGLAGLGGDQIDAIRDYSDRFDGYGKPVMIAECAGHWGGDPAWKMRRDTVGSLWAGIASDLAGTPMSWWWNFNYGDDMGRYYRVAADFMKGEDLIAASAGPGGPWMNRPVVVVSKAGNLKALAAGNRARLFLFLYNFDTLSRTRQVPSVCAENRVALTGLEPGKYRAEYWDLLAGRSTMAQDVTADVTGAAVLEPPDFTEGWAVKVVRPEEAPPAAAALPPVAASAPPAVAAARAGNAADWSWRLEPLVEVVAPEAAARSLLEVRLAVPEACRGLYPRVANAAGAAVPFAWQALDGGAGWQLRIPAAGAGGPLRVTVVAEAPAPLALDEEAFGLGLTVASGGSGWMTQRDQFERSINEMPDKKRTRVPAIDQLENPLGPNNNFLAVYQGPLLAPADGVYEFASNSDDASFTRVDGREIASWPGGHNMEVLDRPAANRWWHRGQMTLKKGMHWVEYDHQQRRGGCLARLGWRMPRPAKANGEETFGPIRDAGSGPDTDVIPAWALDGRIPCRVAVEFQGQARLRLEPCMGLELRRPRTRLFVVAWRGEDTPVYRYYATGGFQQVNVGGLAVPVWAWNAHGRRFSLDWETYVDAQRKPGLKVMLFDIDMPLGVQVGGGSPVEKAVTRRTWTPWPLPEGEAAAFVISAGGVPLVRGVAGGEGQAP